MFVSVCVSVCERVCVLLTLLYYRIPTHVYELFAPITKYDDDM